MASALPARTLAAAAWGLLAAGTAHAGVVEPRLSAHVAALPARGEVAVVVRLSGRGEPPAPQGSGRSARAASLAASLRARASATLPAVAAHLAAAGARRVKPLWAIHALAARVPAGALEALARHPAVESVRLDAVVRAPEVDGGARPLDARSAPPGPEGAAAAVLAEWNLDAVRAPELWALGHTGAGVVVASMDTGVDGGHPDLAGRWRGGSGGWFDPHGEHATPHDASGHGTQTMGLLVGGAEGGTAIGMAPDARWIAVKQYDDAGSATLSDIHLAFQWLLDPDGDPSTADAPDVVNASWGLVDAPASCVDEFAADLQLLRSAGIAVVFSAGNDGAARPGGVSPANDPSAFAAGAVDDASQVASFSSRGPSACGGGTFPRVVAPGVGVRTSDRVFVPEIPPYTLVTGTSYSAPHAAGAMALLAGAFPGATVEQLEEALVQSAIDVGVAGPDPDSGAGVVDVRAAYDALAVMLADRAALAGNGAGAGCSSSGGAASLFALVAALVAARALARSRLPPPPPGGFHARGGAPVRWHGRRAARM